MSISTANKAFPSAYGAGALVTNGGSGGQVIHVTNLNSSGAGSFREALFTTGRRTIVFDVSGEIYIPNEFSIYGYYLEGEEYGNLTIAGETAPAGGITLTGYGLDIQECSNIIIRYIRFRQTNSNDSLGIRGQGSVMVDHCSFTWGKDEAIDASLAGIANVTIQNCLFYNVPKAIIAGSNNLDGNAGDFTIRNNVFVSSSHRFPNYIGDGKIDIINNIIHNWSYRSILFGAQDMKCNHTQNYYQAGTNSINNSLNQGFSTTWDKDRLVSGIHKIICDGTNSPVIYSNYNHLDQDIIDLYQNAWDADPFNQQSPTNNGWTSIDFTDYSETNEFAVWTAFYVDATHQPKSEWFTNTQLPLAGAPFTILDNSQLKSNLLPVVGACKTLNADGSINFWRDSLDIQAADDVENDSSTPMYNIHDSEFRVNPNYIGTSRPANYYNTSKSSHIPELWYDANMPNGASHDDLAPSGYTWLEEFFNQIDGDAVIVNKPSITLVGNSTVNIELGQQYIELGATATDIEDGDLTDSIVVDSSAVDTNTIGSYQVTYNVTDSDSNAAVQVVRVINVVATGNIKYTLTPVEVARNKKILNNLIK